MATINDLIWVGNTLYPRSLVFSIIGLLVMGGVIICLWGSKR